MGYCDVTGTTAVYIWFREVTFKSFRQVRNICKKKTALRLLIRGQSNLIRKKGQGVGQVKKSGKGRQGQTKRRPRSS